MTTWRRIWSVAWRVAVAAVLMAWILHAIFIKETRQAAPGLGIAWDSLSRSQQWHRAWQFGPSELWRTLCLVEVTSLFASLVLMGGTIFLGVVRWRKVLAVQGLDLAFNRAAEISLVAHFFNSFLLGSTGGDLLKAYYAARETHHKKTEAVTTVVVDRLIGLFAMLLFAGLMMLPNLGLLAAHGRLRTLAAAILGMLVICAAIVTVAFWGGVSRRWPQARAWLQRLPKAELWDRFLNACRRFGRERKFLLEAMVLSMALNTVCVLQVAVLAAGLQLEVPMSALFLIVPMIICIAALPITPSGLGVRENLYVLVLAGPVLQVDPTRALSLSLLAYAGSLAWSLLGGLVYATFRQSHHLADITAE